MFWLLNKLKLNFFLNLRKEPKSELMQYELHSKEPTQNESRENFTFSSTQTKPKKISINLENLAKETKVITSLRYNIYKKIPWTNYC